MRVCIDIQSAIAQRAGVGRYTKRLVEELAATRIPADELSLFYFDFQRRGVPFPVPGATQRAVRWLPGRYVQKAWKTVHWPPFDLFAGPAEVFHFPNFIRPPLRRGRSVVTIHDLAFLRLPETIEEKNYRYLKSCIADTVARADAILAVSEFTRQEIIELLRVPPEKVIAIHSGVDAPPPVAASAPSPAGRPFLFSVGTLEPRKNYVLLVDVFDRLTKFDGDLVIAGGRGWKYEPILERIARSPRRAHIRVLDYVSEEELDRLYRQAALFVFPSLYEGFGFPPLEAMIRGTPVVSAATGSLPEVLGDAACVISDFKADEWAAQLASLLQNAEARRILAARGAAHAATFSWRTTAEKTWQVYRNL